MIGGLLARFATPLLLAGLVASSAGLIWNGIALKMAERKLAKAEQKAAEYAGALDRLVAHYNETARVADARERAKEQQHAEATIKLADDLGRQLADKDRTVRLALDGLRHAEDGARRRALLPRETAPAPCRDHAAGADQLPLPDAEFLVGEAARADRIGLRLAACQRYVTEVVLSKEEAAKADVE